MLAKRLLLVALAAAPAMAQQRNFNDGFSSFENPAAVALLVAAFIFIVTNWGQLRSFKSEAQISSREYINVTSNFPGLILTSGVAQFAIQIIAYLALWLAFVYFVNDNPNPDFLFEGDTEATDYYTLWVVTWSLTIAARVLYQFVNNLQWDMSLFSAGFYLSIVEALTWIAAAITAWIYFACLPPNEARVEGGAQFGELSGEELFLALVLSVLALHRLLIVLPFNYYWSIADVQVEEDMAPLIPSGARAAAQPSPFAAGAQSVHQRSAAALAGKKSYHTK